MIFKLNQKIALLASILSFVPLAAKASTFEVVETTIPEIQSAIASEQLTSEQLVQSYLERIEAYDNNGPNINSFININPNALSTARQLDQEREITGLRSPLHGIPILLKDNIDTFDLPTTAGGLILEDSVPPDDAFITQQLRDAGAIILGKANLTEFANFIAFDMPNGFSAVGGQTLNPYNPGVFDVGGSSSGSAAAVAANLVTVSIGTETSGSILSPASSNSLVGIKPTVGLISRDGIIPISASQDTAGPIARTVEDAAIVLSTIAGDDPNDPATEASVGQSFTDYTQFLDPNGLEGSRIGVLRDPFFTQFLNSEELALAETAFDDLEKLGAELVDPVTFPTTEELFDASIEVLFYEFYDGINKYLASLGDEAPAKSLDEIIAFNSANPEEAIPFRQELFLLSQATGGDLLAPEYLNARERDLRLTATEGVDTLLQELDLDALLFPNNIAAFASARPGYPSITVPAGYTDAGEPFGLTFVSDAFSEPDLLRFAFAYEQGTLLRVAPTSTPALSTDTASVPEGNSVVAIIIFAVGTIRYRNRILS